MLATSCAALLLQMTCQKPKDGSLPSFGQLWEYKWQLVPIAILTYFNTGFNNASLGSIALFVNQVIKACAPGPTAFFEWLFTGKLYTCRIYSLIALLIGGCALSNSSSFGRGSTEIGGMLQCLVSLFAAALRPVLQALLMGGGGAISKPCGGACSCLGTDSCMTLLAGDGSKPKLSPPQVLFWDTGIAFFIFLGCFLALEKDDVAAYLSGNTANTNSGWLGLGIVAFGSFLAFMFNIANYYFLFYTSPLTMMIGSNGVKIFILVLSATEESLKWYAWIGVGIVVIAIGSYVHAQHEFKQQQQKPSAETGLTEKTPLAQSGSVAEKA